MHNNNKQPKPESKDNYKNQIHKEDPVNQLVELGNGGDQKQDNAQKNLSAIINEATDAIRKKMPRPSNQKWAHDANGCDLNDDLQGCVLETNSSLSTNEAKHKIKRVDKLLKNGYLRFESNTQFRPGHAVPFALSAGTGDCVSYALALAAYLRDKLDSNHAISVVQYYRKGYPYHTFVVVSKGEFNEQKKDKGRYIKKGIVGDAWVKEPNAVLLPDYFCFDDEIPFIDETDAKGHARQPALDDDDDVASCYAIKYFKPGLSEDIALNKKRSRWERMLERSNHINNQLKNENNDAPLLPHGDPEDYYNVINPTDPIPESSDDDDDSSDNILNNDSGNNDVDHNNSDEEDEADNQLESNHCKYLGFSACHFSKPANNTIQFLASAKTHGMLSNYGISGDDDDDSSLDEWSPLM